MTHIRAVKDTDGVTAQIIVGITDSSKPIAFDNLSVICSYYSEDAGQWVVRTCAYISQKDLVAAKDDFLERYK